MEKEYFSDLFVKSANFPMIFEYCSHHLVFRGNLVYDQCIQKFSNYSLKPVEMEYKIKSKFPPHFLEVEFFDPETKKKDTLVAKIKKKKIAEKRYEDSLAEGNRAVIMEKEDSTEDIYCFSLGNIKPKMHISITTRTIFEPSLETREEEPEIASYHYTIPSSNLDKSKSSKINRKTMDIFIIAENASSVKSLSHINSLFSPGKGFRGFWKTRSKVDCARDFEIEVSFSNHSFCTLSLSPIQFKDFTHAGILSFLPSLSTNIAKSKGHEINILVDCSGSMAGGRIKCAKRALRLLIQSLDPEKNIEYNIYKFGSSYESVFPFPVRLKEDENLKKAKLYIDALGANMGGTDMLKPIEEVLFEETERKKEVFLITDGEDKSENRIEELLEEEHKDNGVRVFTFGIGKNINRPFLENCARLTTGSASFIESASSKNLTSEIIRNLSNSFRESVIDIKVDGLLPFGAIDAENYLLLGDSSLENFQIPLLFNGRSSTKFFLMKKPKNQKKIDHPSITYSFKNKKYSRKVNVIEESRSNHSCVGVRVANDFLIVLEKMEKNNNKIKNDILDFGISFSIPTSQTSFFMELESKDTVISEMKVMKIDYSRKEEELDEDINEEMKRYDWTSSSSEEEEDEDFSGKMNRLRKIKVNNNNNNNRSLLFSAGGGDEEEDGFIVTYRRSRKKVKRPINKKKKQPETKKTMWFMKESLDTSSDDDEGCAVLYSDYSDSEEEDGNKNEENKEKNQKVVVEVNQEEEKKKEEEEEEDVNESKIIDEEINIQKSINSGVNDDILDFFSFSPVDVKVDISSFLDNPESMEEKKKELEITEANKMEILRCINTKFYNDLLLLCDVRGIWKVNSKTLGLCGFASRQDLIEITKPKKMYHNNLDFWITSIILELLSKFFRNRKDEWFMIFSKSKKSLIKAFGEQIIMDAKCFVSLIV